MSHVAPPRVTHRFWCGALPSFHLLSEGELAQEQAISLRIFGSQEWASRRTQLRLKLKETPLLTQVRCPASEYTQLLALFKEYLPFVLGLRQCVVVDRNEDIPGDETFPAMLYGFGGADLSQDRVVGRDHQLQFTLPTEIMLVFVAMGQLHAVSAEAMAEEGTRLQSTVLLAQSERAWRASTNHFSQAGHIASASLAQCMTGDPALATIVKFFRGIASQAVILARLAQIHEVSSRLGGRALVGECCERLCRSAVVYARYAYTLAEQTLEISTLLADSPLSRQLSWLVESYTARWKTIYYSYEQSVLQLDSNPELALSFCDCLLQQRLTGPPSYSQREDSYFARVTHTIQLAHHSQLNETMQEKVCLLTVCRKRLGALWTPETLSPELGQLIARIPFLELLPNGDQQNDSNYTDAAVSLNFDGDAINELANTVAIHFDRSTKHCDMEFSSIIEHASETFESEQTSSNRKTLNSYSDSRNVTSQHPLSKEDTELHFDIDSASSAKSNIPSDEKKRPRPASSKLVSRPSSGQLPSRIQPTIDSGWVTMKVGGRELHFEKSALPSRRPATASDFSRRKSGSLTTVGVNQFDQDQSSRLIRDSKTSRSLSSPICLRVKKCCTGKMDGALTWVPNRIPCALCERRFMRRNLPGVVVMKRIFDLRQKWGMVVQGSKKFEAASALYEKANVCLMCQDILAFEDDQALVQFDRGGLVILTQPSDDEVGSIIRNRILQNWATQPPLSSEHLLDVAVNKRARQSSTNFGQIAQNAVLSNSIRAAQTKEEMQPWWEVDLANYYVVHTIKIWLREEGIHGENANLIDSTVRFHSSASHSGDELNSSRSLNSGSRPNFGLHPLHLCISMKSGVGRDLDDIVASAVSSHCVEEKGGQPIVWVVPPNSRGRFVRIQSEAYAYLQIDKVNVLVLQDLVKPQNPVVGSTADEKRNGVRTQLKRAALRATVVIKPLAQREPEPDGLFDEKDAALTAAMFATRSRGTDTQQGICVSQGFLTAFGDTELAEKRRVSRLYTRFRSLLDARTKYSVEEQQDQTKDQP